MLKRLIDIRNIVEHQGSNPPPTDECLMFADLVWYLLRSTDRLVQTQVETLIFKPPGMISGNFQRVMLNFRVPFSEPPKIDAWLHAPIIDYEPKPNWINIDSAELIRHEHPDTFWMAILGKVRGAEEQMKLIYDIYFGTSHFR